MTLQPDSLENIARDPSTIVGIFNYCDRRCERCRFTSRCTLYRSMQEDDARHPDSTAVESAERSLAEAVALLERACEEHGIDFETSADRPPDSERLRDDPLVRLGESYAHMAHPIVIALQSVVARRNDPALTDAVRTIEWFSTLIASKIFRAVAGLDDDRDNDAIQTDFNGSAKVARIGVAESIAAWSVLMELGKATADGVPAQAVATLQQLDAALAQRFPRAAVFVRPGFDEVQEKTRE